MDTGSAASLLDNAQFLEELGKVEALPNEDTRAFPKPVPTMADGTSATAEAPPEAIGPRVQGPQFMLPPPRTRSRKAASSGGQVRTAARSRRSVSETPTSAPTTRSASYGGQASDSDRTPTSASNGARARIVPVEESLSSFPAETAQEPVVKAAVSVKANRPSETRPALAVVGFVLMMSIGAGAAALVFHDRVAQIVAQWQSASR